MMKRTLFCIFLSFVTMVTYATGLDGDVIYVDGTQWVLLGRPIDADLPLCHALKSVLPADRSKSMANRDGYTAFWSIKHDVLYLDSIQYELYDKATQKRWSECMSSDTLLCVFRNYQDGQHIMGTWFSGEIRIAKGKMIYYQHDAWKRNYENEQSLDIDHGRVLGQKAYHNYVVEGFSFDNLRPNDNAALKEKFPISMERYPELANVKRIVFNIKEACVDSLGNLVDCVVTASVWREGQREEHRGIAAEMEESLKAYHPWRVLFINGTYRAYGIAGWVFQYR